jgi:hypothetical protein
MDSKTPVPTIEARRRIIAAYKSPEGRLRFDKILDYEADRDESLAWTIFAYRTCKDLPATFVLDAVDLARIALVAMRCQARAQDRIVTHYERVGA